jgi:hypothetical protein
MKSYLFLLLLVFSCHSHSQTCNDILSLEQIESLQIGQSVEVSVKENSHIIEFLSASRFSLIVLGRTARGLDFDSEVIVFSDKNLNTYYFPQSEILINGKDISSEVVINILPPILRQNEGSCNLCANVTAINSLAINQGLEPIGLSARSIEASSEATIFSAEANVREFLDQLFISMWPNGYQVGLEPRVSIQDMMRAIREFKQRNLIAFQQGLSNSSAGAGSELVLPIDVVSERTSKASVFMNHLKNGGTSVLGGIVDENATQEIYPSPSEGSVPKAILIPYRRNIFSRISMRFKHSVALSKFITRINQHFEEGNLPDDDLVREAMKHLFTQVGHAIAAVGVISSGSLAGHVIIANSWGVYEVHPPEVFVNGINNILISPEEQ